MVARPKKSGQIRGRKSKIMFFIKPELFSQSSQHIKSIYFWKVLGEICSKTPTFIWFRGRWKNLQECEVTHFKFYEITKYTPNQILAVLNWTLVLFWKWSTSHPCIFVQRSLNHIKVGAFEQISPSTFQKYKLLMLRFPWKNLDSLKKHDF